MAANPKVSVVIPVYMEEANIFSTIKLVAEAFKSFNYTYEIIIIIDGSPDLSEQEARRYRSKQVKIYSYAKNRGKGYAVKYGVERANGDIITFTDAGGDFNPGQFDRFIKLMEAFDADIVIGSKRHPASRVNYPRLRRAYSWCYYALVKLLFGLRVTDTQTGLKFFKGGVAKSIFPRALVKQYAIDLELLVIAKQLNYRRIFEAPVEMEFNASTRGAANFKAISRMFIDTLAIFYRSRILNYYRKERI